jgi:hypothetical protein
MRPVTRLTMRPVIMPDDETRGHAGVAPWSMKPCNARQMSILSYEAIVNGDHRHSDYSEGGMKAAANRSSKYGTTSSSGGGRHQVVSSMEEHDLGGLHV